MIVLPNNTYKFSQEILMQNFGIESIFKPTVWNECIHQDSNDKCVKIVKFATHSYVHMEIS